MQSGKGKNKFLTVKEVAERLRVSERSVFRYINKPKQKKKLIATKIGYWRITEKDLQNFIKANDNSNI